MIGPSSSAADLIAHLQTLRSEDGISGLYRFAIEQTKAVELRALGNDLHRILADKN